MRKVGFKDPSKICHGIDISAWQEDVNMDTVNDNSLFSFIKATEGTGYFSKHFTSEWLDSKANGVIRAPYHYFSYGVDGIAQAKFFLSKFKLEVGDLPPILDWEAPAAEPKNGGNPTAYAEEALKFMEYVEAQLGIRPIFYTYPGFFSYIENTSMGDKFAKYPLWIANYGVSTPLTPKQWANWDFWQYTDKYYLDAGDSKIDANWFNGSKEDLLKMCKQAPAVVKPNQPPEQPSAPAEKKKCVLAFLFGT